MKPSPALLAAAACVLANPLPAQDAPERGQLEYIRWTPDFEVPDPVAISFDAEGRAYVTQTQRRKSQDLDIRNNRDWIVDDVGLQSVDEKRALYHERLAPEHSAANTKRVDDLNGDGSHDYLDLMQLSELIHLIEDTDGDGLADSIRLWADDFQTEVTGIAAGVMHHDDAVYATIAPDVWRLRDRDGDGRISGADEREIIATGFGLHIAYAGHDMHGLTVGPDGKIYWSIGDKGISVTSREGRKFHYPNQGGVMRCDPDGSNFEVFAHGLRNVQELAFDDYGNLFGVDNDADKPGEMERFVYIVRGMDAGWRCNYQYREKDQFNPWTDEQLWKPYHEGQPLNIVPPIRNYVNGPAGFTRDPGTALGPAYRGYFFLTSAPNGQQWAFRVEADGASFKMVDDHQIGDGKPIVGINFGPDGALYGVDWGGGYPLNQKGAVWKIDVPGAADSEIRRQTAEELLADYTTLRTEQLIERLGHPDQRVRLKAQFEFVRREDPEVPAGIAFNGASTELARVHALWALGQMGAFIPQLNELAAEPNSELRAQFARLAGEAGEAATLYTESLIKLCADPSARVQFFAALGLGETADPTAVPALLELAATLTPDQAYLRHAVVTGLAGCAASDSLAELTGAKSEAQRLCATLALRRQNSPAVAAFLDDPSESIAAEAARAIHDDFSIVEALPELAASLDSETTAQARGQSFVRRSLNAALRVGSSGQAGRVAGFVTRTADPAMTLEALRALEDWATPAPLDRVTGRHRSFDPRDSADLGKAVEPHLSDWLQHDSTAIQAGGLRVAASLGIEVAGADLLAVLEREKNPVELRLEALNSLASQQADELADAVDAALIARDAELRIRAGELLATIDVDRAVEHLVSIAGSEKATLGERQAAFAGLAGLDSPEVDAFLKDSLARLTSGEAPAELQLDILEAAETRATSAPGVAAELEIYRGVASSAGPLASFSVCLEGGDRERGRRIFTEHIAAQCTACHKADDGKGSTVGPNLKGIGKQQSRDYLLESLVDPQKTIAAGFGMISLTLQNGGTVAGILRKETEDRVELLDGEGKSLKVAVADITTRSPVVSTMPPMGAILSKREIRDLVAFLHSLK